MGLGTTGPAATCVEQALAAKGYTVTVNASLGAADITALDAFVASQGWTPDGRAGPAALGRLGIYAPPPPAAPTCRISTTVRLGSTGAAAQCLEQHLRHRGFAVTVDANFDATDVTALRAYQRQQGLLVDGVAGPVTLGRLGIYATATVTPPASAAGVPANSGSGRRIVYSRAQQRVWAIDAGGTVVKTHRVSGRMGNPYAGTYSVYSRSMYTYASGNPDVKWRYMVRFAYGVNGGRIGFHEIPTKFGVPLQSVSQLGQPLSSGCVRQSTADALWVWNWAGIGTKVVVL